MKVLIVATNSAIAQRFADDERIPTTDWLYVNPARPETMRGLYEPRVAAVGEWNRLPYCDIVGLADELLVARAKPYESPTYVEKTFPLAPRRCDATTEYAFPEYGYGGSTADVEMRTIRTPCVRPFPHPGLNHLAETPDGPTEFET
jgi:hypothetical protein